MGKTKRREKKQMVVIFNSITKKYWTGLEYTKNAMNKVKHLNQFRCGQHYIITGKGNVEAALTLLENATPSNSLDGLLC